MAAAALLAVVFGGAVDSVALPESKLMPLLASEGFSSIWRVDQGDVSATFGRSITAYETPRQISDGVCASREIDLGVREETGAILFRKVIMLVALRNCHEATPETFARVFGVSNDKRLADIAHAVVLFLRTQTAAAPNVPVTFQSDAARDLAKLGASGRLVEILQFGGNQVSATIETDESKPRHLSIDLRFEDDFLREIRASESFAGVVR